MSESLLSRCASRLRGKQHSLDCAEVQGQIDWHCTCGLDTLRGEIQAALADVGDPPDEEIRVVQTVLDSCEAQNPRAILRAIKLCRAALKPV